MWVNHIYWLGHDIGRLHINLVSNNKDSALSHIAALDVDIGGIGDGLDIDVMDVRESVFNYGLYIGSLDKVDSEESMEKYFEMVDRPINSLIWPLFEKEWRACENCEYYGPNGRLEV